MISIKFLGMLAVGMGSLMACMRVADTSGLVVSRTFPDSKSLSVRRAENASEVPSRLSFDFNDGPTWNGAHAYTTSANLNAKATWAPVGSYNIADSKDRSGGWLLRVDSSASRSKGSAGLVSGPLTVSNRETNLGKLTLALTLSANIARPVTVKIASLDARGKRTGELRTSVTPAAPNFPQRYALDLNTFQASDGGKFDPKAPRIELAFEIDNRIWPAANNEICVDDVSFSSPAYYVNPKGGDDNDGRTEKTAFATVQKALDMAQPGDIICLMEGKYDGGNAPVASFPRAGAPAAWIVLKNYPGQHPLLTSTGWNIVSIVKGKNGQISEEPALAYLEIRGLHIRGVGDVAKTKYPDAMNKPDSRTNSNGIAVDGRYMKNIPHHIRIADNLVEYCPALGLGTNETDWVTIENNITRYNSWTTIYGTSGISTLGASNFDMTDNVYKILVRNNISYGNETREICVKDKRLTDGNGIIIDVNQKTAPHPDRTYIGRTLVQNNLCFDNGGSGIHTVQANRVDIVNNTAYLNSASKGLEYSQIFTFGSEDVRIMNNILVAPVADVAAGEKPEPVNRLGGKNANVVFSHNLYYGGNIAPTLGEEDVIGDPHFVKPSRDGKIADFHLQTGSLAIAKGKEYDFSPCMDIDGNLRRIGTPSKGAYEK